MQNTKAVSCDQCGVESQKDFFSNIDPNQVAMNPRNVCRMCQPNPFGNGATEEIDETEAALKARQLKAGNITVTTGFTTAAGPITEEIDVITSECVYGINVFKDMPGDVRDIVGGRASAQQKVLRYLRQTCLDELRMNAAEIDADAVIGVDLDYCEISGANGGLLMLVASGTAVRLDMGTERSSDH
jgi:uncharacterized protein YbjQ (UPF0145 family)